jgi:hypothetical protein
VSEFDLVYSVWLLRVWLLRSFLRLPLVLPTVVRYVVQAVDTCLRYGWVGWLVGFS